MHDVSVETFVEYVKQRDVEGIETALQRYHYDIDTPDTVSTSLSAMTSKLMLNSFRIHVVCIPTRAT
jgi:hypothetical protein